MEWSMFGFLGDLAEAFSIFSGYFYNWYTNLFTMTMRDAFSVVLDIPIPDWAFLNTSMGVFMFGSGLAIYVGYQLIKWVVDILP